MELLLTETLFEWIAHIMLASGYLNDWLMVNRYTYLNWVLELN